MRTSRRFFHVRNCICFILPPTISLISFFFFLGGLFFSPILFFPSRRILFPCARQKGLKINVQYFFLKHAFHAQSKTEMTSLLLLNYNKNFKHNRVWCSFFFLLLFCCWRAQNWIKGKRRHVKAFPQTANTLLERELLGSRTVENVTERSELCFHAAIKRRWVSAGFWP